MIVYVELLAICKTSQLPMLCVSRYDNNSILVYCDSSVLIYIVIQFIIF